MVCSSCMLPRCGMLLTNVRLVSSPRHATCPAAANDGAKRQAVCSLLCELYLADAIPETVIFDCLEQLLWDVSGTWCLGHASKIWAACPRGARAWWKESMCQHGQA